MPSKLRVFKTDNEGKNIKSFKFGSTHLRKRPAAHEGDFDSLLQFLCKQISNLFYIFTDIYLQFGLAFAYIFPSHPMSAAPASLFASHRISQCAIVSAVR